MKKHILIQGIAILILMSLFTQHGRAEKIEAAENAPATDRGPSLVLNKTLVDIPRQFSDMGRNLALDQAGHPHIAYGEDNLYYAWHDGSDWHQEVVDNGVIYYGVGTYVSLALDAAGRPHISYFDEMGAKLKYAYYDGNSWHKEIVDTPVFGHSSIALDAAGHPHISYCSYMVDVFFFGCGSVKYAYHDGSAWQIQTVDVVAVWRANPSIAISSTGVPYISYYKDYDTALQLAWYQNGNWQFTTLNNIADKFSLSSLALDTHDNPYICYYSEGKLLITFMHDSQWVTEIIDTVGGADPGVMSLALDRNDQPRVSYNLFYAHALGYAYKDDTGWHPTWVDVSEGLNLCVWNSLALDSRGYPHISYYIGYPPYRNGRLRYASYNGAAWQFETVDSNTVSVGEFPSIAVDNAGHPSIVYRGTVAQTPEYAPHDDVTWLIETAEHPTFPGSFSYVLKYAHYNGATWQIDIVDDSGQVGSSTSLALDTGGRPHICYNLDTAGGTLVYAYKDISGWYSEAVAVVGAPHYPYDNVSLALDSTDLPHIGYYDDDDGGLKYAHYNGSAWITETVDSSTKWITQTMKAGVSLALDDNDQPHLSYIASGAVKYAHYDGSAWQIETVWPKSSEYQAFRSNTSLALDTDGWPHISFSRAGNINGLPADKTTYAYKDESGWHLETVSDSSSTALSLVLDSSGQPHISFSVEGNLNYAYRTSSGWQIDPLGWVGDISSAMDASDVLHIGYGANSLVYTYAMPYTLFLGLLVK
jgi:hypothetical protein